METENTVSIWVGNFESKSQLDEFLTLIYDDEGEVVPSLFYESYEINIDDIDDDWLEAEVYEMNHSNLEQMFKGASYDQTILRNLKEEGINTIIPPSNTIILLYNYHYIANVVARENTSFIGTASYKEAQFIYCKVVK